MITIANTVADRQLAYDLRYQIYVDELERDFLATSTEQKNITDTLDNQSTIMISKDENGAATGTLRVTISGWAPWLEERFGIHTVLPSFTYAVVDNFVLQPVYRNSRLALKYIIGVFEYGVDRKVDLCLIETAPDLLPMYEKLGFTPYRIVQKHGHERYQLAIRPFDIEHLRSCRSIFYKIMHRRQQSLVDSYGGHILPELVRSVS